MCFLSCGAENRNTNEKPLRAEWRGNKLEANAHDVTSGMGYIGRKVLRQAV